MVMTNRPDEPAAPADAHAAVHHTVVETRLRWPVYLSTLAAVGAIGAVAFWAYANRPPSRRAMALIVEAAYQESKMSALADAAEQYQEKFGYDPRIEELRAQALVEQGLGPLRNLLRAKHYDAAAERVEQLG